MAKSKTVTKPKETKAKVTKTVTKKATVKATTTKKTPVKKTAKKKVAVKVTETEVKQIGAEITETTLPENAPNPSIQEELTFDMPKTDGNVIVNAKNIGEIINGMGESGAVQQTFSNPSANLTEQAKSNKEMAKVNPKALSHVTTQAVSHGETLLTLINQDWRMGAWGGVPLSIVQEMVGKGSKEYQFEVINESQGAYFYLKIGEDSHRFPNEGYIKIV